MYGSYIAQVILVKGCLINYYAVSSDVVDYVDVVPIPMFSSLILLVHDNSGARYSLLAGDQGYSHRE